MKPTNSKQLNKSLTIDFLSFTYPVKNPVTRKNIHKRIIRLKNNCKKSSPISIDETRNTIVCIKYANKYDKAGRKQNYIQQYFETCLFDINAEKDKFIVKISYNPIDNRKRFLRVEFNPSKAQIDGVKTVCQLLEVILGYKRASSIFTKAKITRLDITLDRFGLKHNYYAHVDKVSISKCHKTEATIDAKDVKDTQVLGSPKGKVMLTIYDKSAEQHLKRAKDVPDNTLRFEFRIRNLDYPMASLLTAGNPFKTLHLYSIKLLHDDLFDYKFIQRVKTFGVPYALGSLGSYCVRRQHVNRLKRYEKPVISANGAWKQWPTAIEVLAPFKTMKTAT